MDFELKPRIFKPDQSGLVIPNRAVLKVRKPPCFAGTAQ